MLILDVSALDSSPVFWIYCHYIERFISLHFNIINEVRVESRYVSRAQVSFYKGTWVVEVYLHAFITLDIRLR